MTNQRKLSEIMQEMLRLLLRDPNEAPSWEATHVAIFLASAAWNESVGTRFDRSSYHKAWEAREAKDPALWDELKSTDTDAMLEELVEYKKSHYPHDGRQIVTCGTVDGGIHVEWLAPTGSKEAKNWRMQLYGLVRTGQRKEAVRFLQTSLGISRNEARRQVMEIAREFRQAMERL